MAGIYCNYECLTRKFYDSETQDCLKGARGVKAGFLLFQRATLKDVRSLAVAIATVLLATAACGPPFSAALDQNRIAADGFSRAQLRTSARGQEIRIVEGSPHTARLEGTSVIAGIMPGKVTIAVRSVRLTLEVTPSWTDRYQDGTPDFLRLDDPGDRDAFLAAFTGIALHAQPPLSEVADCSAFLRYAYGEALRNGFEGRRIAKYQLPWTPLGPRVFHTPDGPAEFADADTLRRFNTHFLSRDIRLAQPGDLLFFRQPDQKSPFHAMIVVDRNRLAYHTGPIGKDPGEIRRPTLDELLRHELPKWRPLAGNGNFLGVFRWNILRQDS